MLYTAHNQDICSSPQITVQGTINGRRAAFTFTPDVNNVMSYFGGCPPPDAGPTHFHFSAQQIQRFDVTLKHQSRRALIESPLLARTRCRRATRSRADQIGSMSSPPTSTGARGSATGPDDPAGHLESLASRAAGHLSANAPVGVVSRHPNKLDIFVPGQRQRDAHRRPGQGLREPPMARVVEHPHRRDSARAAHVTAVSRDPNKLDIFIVSTDGGVYTAAWDHERRRTRSGAAGGDIREPGRDTRSCRSPSSRAIRTSSTSSSPAATARPTPRRGMPTSPTAHWRGWWNILTGAIPAGGTITGRLARS